MIEQEPGNLLARYRTGGGGGSIFKLVRVTVVPSSGRKQYTGKVAKHSDSSGTLVTTQLMASYTFYNALESTSGTAFLVVGDEAMIFKNGNVWICSEIPRGF